MKDNHPNILQGMALDMACFFEKMSASDECLTTLRLARPLGAHAEFYYPPLSEGIDRITETIVLYNYNVEGDEMPLEHQLVIEEFALKLIDYPGIRLDFVIGRASNTGPEDTGPNGFGGNWALSQQRAQQVWFALEDRLTDFMVDEAQVYARMGDIDSKLLAYGSEKDPILNRPGHEEPLNRSVTIEYSYTLPPEVIEDTKAIWEPVPDQDDDTRTDDPDDRDDANNPECKKPSTLWELDFDIEMGAEVGEIYKLLKGLKKFVPLEGGFSVGKLQDMQRKAAHEVGLIFLGFGWGVKDISTFIDNKINNKLGGFLLNKLKEMKKKIPEKYEVMLEQLDASNVVSSVWHDFDKNADFQTAPACFDDFDWIPVLKVEAGGNLVIAGADTSAIILAWPPLWNWNKMISLENFQVSELEANGFPVPIAFSSGVNLGPLVGAGAEASAVIGLLLLGGETEFEGD